MANEDLSTVTYSVKELLAQIQHGVTVLDTKLDNKADKADVVALAARIGILERFKERAVGAAIIIGAAGSGIGYAFKEILS